MSYFLYLVENWKYSSLKWFVIFALLIVTFHFLTSLRFPVWRLWINGDIGYFLGQTLNFVRKCFICLIKRKQLQCNFLLEIEVYSFSWNSTEYYAFIFIYFTQTQMHTQVVILGSSLDCAWATVSHGKQILGMGSRKCPFGFYMLDRGWIAFPSVLSLLW